MMKRRDFLKNIGVAVGGPIMLNGLGLSALAKSGLFSALDDESDRVLILVQLNGGNDGLNTYIPLDQYDHLVNARSNILIPENNILPVTDTLGFHPNLGGLKALYDEGRIGLVQSVGYPNQNRSHFRSIEIWSSGSPAEEQWTTGWAGRYLDQQNPGFPEGYPTYEKPDPFAITMGFLVSETCQGQASNFAITLSDPFTLSNLAEWETDEYAGTLFGEELAFVRESISLTNQYAQRIQQAAGQGANLATYPDTQLANQLKTVALLIAGGLKTRIYTVTLNGFDTHSGQVVDGNPAAGVHAELLKTLSDAIKAFQDDLSALGHEERVLGMTFSEFGRQIRSNGSYGTDHGTAAPLLLFGPCANGRITGDNPEIPEEVAIQEGVAMQYDFRDVYGSVLVDWFEMPLNAVKNILHEDFQYLPILACGKAQPGDDTVVHTTDLESGGATLAVYPNPFSNTISARFSCGGGMIRLSLFDAKGQEIRVLKEGRINPGAHEAVFDGSNLPSGNYYLHLRWEKGRKTVAMVKR